MGKASSTSTISYIPANGRSIENKKEKYRKTKVTKQKREKVVEVIECPNFNFSKSINNLKGVKKETTDAEILNKKDESKKGKDEMDEFKNIYRQVIEYGASNFDGRKKKDYEAKRITQLGGKGVERINIPYNILMGIKKKEKMRQEARDDYVKASDIVTGEKKFSATYAGGSVNITGRGKGKQNRGKDISSYDDVTKSVEESKVGKYRDGMLYINKSMLQHGKNEKKGKGGQGSRGKGKRR